MKTFLSTLYVQLKKSYCLTPPEAKLKNQLSSVVGKGGVTPNARIITIQCVEDYYFFGLFCALAASLKEKNNISFEQYIVRSLRAGSSQSIARWLTSILFSNRFTDKKWISFYRLFCDKVAFRTSGLSGYICNLKLLLVAVKIWYGLSSKDDVLKLTWQGVLIGDLVYDSYLRFKPAPTVNAGNLYMLAVIWQTLRTYKSAEEYFSIKMPSAYFTSYTTYIQHGVPVRVALNLGIPVYSFGNFQELAKKLELGDPRQTANCSMYFDDFQKLKNKDAKLLAAEKQLGFRISGGIDAATAYMAKSAYHSDIDMAPDVTGSVVVFLHDFYDSPHIYSWILFPDFYEWICFTIETLRKNNIPFFLKAHPNQSDLSSDVINMLMEKYPDLQWISAPITNRMLVDAGMRCAVTVYGTVAHEMAFLGVPVITCGDNPHISFDFCKNATSLEEYRYLLKNSLSVDVDPAQMKIQSLMFYYMHNQHKDQTENAVMDATQQLFRLTRLRPSETGDMQNVYDAITGLIEMKEFKTLCCEKFGRHLT